MIAYRPDDSEEASPPSGVRAAPAIVKQCSCGWRFNLAEWNALRLVGVLHDENDSDEDLEMRNCRCGSTIALSADFLPPSAK